MIFLSAQPDEIYFLWQLQLQLDNFHSLGIPAEQIHVLIGYRGGRGLHPAFRQLADKNPNARFFFYEDTRSRRNYLSSIRPHLIAKHFTACPELEEATIFYHDSDILLHHLPDWSALTTDDVWYASDTRSYLDTQYICRCIGQDGFWEMCRLLSISPHCVLANDSEAGGAQYILKKCPVTFWQKVENDCENLYVYLRDRAGENRLDPPSNDEETILYWCTDMWVVWWNALLEGKTYRISPLLDFCWPKEKLDTWKIKPILHYAGKVETTESSVYFRKGNYREYPPFYDDFSSIRPDSCSRGVAEQIALSRAQLDRQRYTLPDTSILVLQPEGSSAAQTKNYVRYLNKYIDVRIETASTPVEAARALNETTMPYLYLCQADSLVPIRQLLAVVEQLRGHKAPLVLPYDGTLHTLDPLSAYLFGKLLDTDLMEENKGKYLTTYSLDTQVEAFGINLETIKWENLQAGAETPFAHSLFPVGDCFNRLSAKNYAVAQTEGAVYNFTLQKLKKS